MPLTEEQKRRVMAMAHRIEDLFYTLRSLDRDGLIIAVGDWEPHSVRAVIALLTKATGE